MLLLRKQVRCQPPENLASGGQLALQVSMKKKLATFFGNRASRCSRGEQAGLFELLAQVDAQIFNSCAGSERNRQLGFRSWNR